MNARPQAPSSGDFFDHINPKRFGVGIALLFLAALSTQVFVLNLAPVYGALPLDLFHKEGMALSGLAGFFLKGYVSRPTIRRALYLLPVIAFWIPTVLYFILQIGPMFGNLPGAMLTDVLVFYPLIILTILCSRELVHVGLRLDRYDALIANHIPFMGLYVIYSVGYKIIHFFLSRVLGFTFLFSRAGLQLVIAALYAAAIPSKLLVLTIPSILFSIFFNVHIPLGYMTTSLNSHLNEEGFVLLERHDSTTGYLSVLENTEEKYRVIRCDHSLLGGQWTGISNEIHPTIKEPVYAVFTMLEAVRLVQNDQGNARPDVGKKALVM